MLIQHFPIVLFLVVFGFAQFDRRLTTAFGDKKKKTKKMIATSGSDKPSVVTKKPWQLREEKWVVFNKANKKVYRRIPSSKMQSIMGEEQVTLTDADRYNLARRFRRKFDPEDDQVKELYDEYRCKPDS